MSVVEHLICNKHCFLRRTAAATLGSRCFTPQRCHRVQAWPSYPVGSLCYVFLRGQMYVDMCAHACTCTCGEVSEATTATYVNTGACLQASQACMCVRRSTYARTHSALAIACHPWLRSCPSRLPCAVGRAAQTWRAIRVLPSCPSSGVPRRLDPVLAPYSPVVIARVLATEHLLPII